MIPIDAFPKIDAHIHFNSDRDVLLKFGEKFNFSFITINTEVPSFPSIENQQKIAKKYRHNSGTDLSYITTISTEKIEEKSWCDNAIEKIKQDIQENGALGVKFWKNIGMSIKRSDGSFIMLDDPELRPIFDFLEEHQVPVLGHQGEPKNCWLPVEEMTVNSDKEYFAEHPQYHMYLHEEYPGYWKHIEARDAILKRHPDLIFVGAHLASLEWNLNEVAARLDKFPYMAVDLAERMSHLEYHAARDRDKVIDFFKTYQDRIIYGTDIIDDPQADPADISRELKHRWKKHWSFFSSGKKMTSSQIEDSFNGLKLSESILQKIYRLNVLKWYKVSE